MGRFPSLLMNDPDFTDFNLHSFGYPTSLTGQVSDLRDQGELLASFLREETLPSYRSTVLVGHSIGGLVVLHALLSLDKHDPNLLLEADVKVLTFGTPFVGVQNAGTLRVLGNAQAKDVEALNKHLHRLKKDWEQRFNRTAEPGQNTPQVPIYAYYGTEDGFVVEASACGGPAKTCEPVDGDHITIVKPLDREHLAYKKLRAKALGATLKVPPTPRERIGIWVARVLGDNEIRGAQGSIVENLRDHIAREPELKQAVEIRELPVSIAGNTDYEEKIEADRLGKQYNAAILVWGKITGVFKPDEFRAKVMLVKRVGITSEPVHLSKVTEASLQQAQMSSPPGIVGLPVESVREPVQLARVVIAFTFLEQEKWAEAARQFQIFIESGLSPALKVPDVYFYAGFVNYKTHENTGSPELLGRAKETYLKALAGYQQEGTWDQYAAVQNNLGLIYRVLAERGVEPEQNLQRSVDALKEAARLRKEQQNWAKYAGALFNLGLTQEMRATEGPDRRMSLAAARTAYEEALSFFAQARLNEWEAEAATRLKSVLQALIAQGVDVEKNQARLTGLTKAK